MADQDRATPRQRIEAEGRRRGRLPLIAGCIDLIEGRDADDGLILALGGEPARYVLDGGEGGRDGYWPRVWAARGLLHAWDDQATPAVIAATGDEAWRVREMAARVVARHRVGDALDAMSGLQDDAVPRVRQAAGRAIAVLTASGA